MYICLCYGINESTLLSKINAGTSDLKCIMKDCGAGGDCGACVKDIKRILKSHKLKSP